MAASTKPDSFGLVITIMVAEPRNSTTLRSATDTDEPTADLICVVSAVSREVSSPVRAVSKNGADSAMRWPNTAGAKIRHHALAERGHEVVARGAGEREHGHHRDHHAEILVDQPDVLGVEAEVDHPPHGDRHHQRGDRGGQQRHERGRRPAAVAHHVGNQQLERAELDLAGGRGRDVRRRGRCRFKPCAAGGVVHVPVPSRISAAPGPCSAPVERQLQQGLSAPARSCIEPRKSNEIPTAATAAGP